MGTHLSRLREVLGEVADLEEAARLLYWDLETYLPPNGFVGRGHVLSPGHDHVLDAPVHVQRPVGLEPAAVAAVQPAVGCERAARHHRAAHEDLAAGADLQLDAGQRPYGAACRGRGCCQGKTQPWARTSIEADERVLLRSTHPTRANVGRKEAGGRHANHRLA